MSVEAVVPELGQLRERLLQLTPHQQRCSLSLLGLAIGDVVGLPFELAAHRANRAKADSAAANGDDALFDLVLRLVVERLGSKGPLNVHSRTFSDDTTVADAKMAAVAQWDQLLRRQGFDEGDPDDLLWKCLLSQLLAWSEGPSHKGALFQGYGGFTKGLLRPRDLQPRCLNIGEDLPGCDTWPESSFVTHAESYCAGESWSPKSYGNGALMSYAPQAVASALLADFRPATARLERTHQHEEAVLAARLLGEVLDAILGGALESCADLRGEVLKAECWKDLLQSHLARHPAYPLGAFDAFLRQGDCNEGAVSDFMQRLVAPDPLDASSLAPQAGAAYLRPNGRGLQMGRLLRSAANWDDDFRSREARLALPEGGDVRFSQRGLNTVLIAIWCCCEARTCRDWLARVVYVGGDSDTVGAVCGQLAGPLLDPSDVCCEFGRFVATEGCSRPRLCAKASRTAALRYFQRALLFSCRSWPELSRLPRLTDVVGVAECDAVHVLWVDRALSGARFDPRLYHGRHKDAAYRRRAKADALGRGVRLIRAASVDEAQAALRDGRSGAALDVVVAELGLDRADAGLEVMASVESLWGDDEARPYFLLLTPRWDRKIVECVKRTSRCRYLRHDDADAISQAILAAPCQAAVLPGAHHRELTSTASPL